MWRVSAQADDAEDEDDPRRNEDGLDDASTDVADREVLVLPPRNRVEHNRRGDVRKDEEKLEEGSQVDLVVLPATGDVPGRVIEYGLEQSERPDRRDERDDEEHTEDTRSPLILRHPI